MRYLAAFRLFNSTAWQWRSQHQKFLGNQNV